MKERTRKVIQIIRLTTVNNLSLSEHDSLILILFLQTLFVSCSFLRTFDLFLDCFIFFRFMWFVMDTINYCMEIASNINLVNHWTYTYIIFLHSVFRYIVKIISKIYYRAVHISCRWSSISKCPSTTQFVYFKDSSSSSGEKDFAEKLTLLSTYKVHF